MSVFDYYIIIEWVVGVMLYFMICLCDVDSFDGDDVCLLCCCCFI